MTARPSPRLPHKSAAEISADLREQLCRVRRTGSPAPRPAPIPYSPRCSNRSRSNSTGFTREADQVFFGAALDDLIRGLGMPARLARPAQAVVQFSQLSARETISPEIELVGYQQSGEPAGVRPRCHGRHRADRPGVRGHRRRRAPNDVRRGRPPLDQPALVARPLESRGALERGALTLFLAFETDALHLSRIGLFVETASPTSTLPATLARSPWQCSTAAAGVRTGRSPGRPDPWRDAAARLPWRLRPRIETVGAASVVPLVAGVVGDAVWLFPKCRPNAGGAPGSRPPLPRRSRA